MLTKSAKERFELWYLCTQRRYKGFLVIPQEDFYVLPIAMQFGVYRDFFLSMSIEVYIKPTTDGEHSIYIDNRGKHILTEYLIFPTLNEARNEAIILAGIILEDKLAEKDEDKDSTFKRGEPVLVTYGFNKVLGLPFKFLYDFAYYSPTHCIVYNHGESNMQDAHAFTLDQIEKATKDDLKNYTWGK